MCTSHQSRCFCADHNLVSVRWHTLSLHHKMMAASVLRCGSRILNLNFAFSSSPHTCTNKRTTVYTYVQLLSPIERVLFPVVYIILETSCYNYRLSSLLYNPSRLSPTTGYVFGKSKSLTNQMLFRQIFYPYIITTSIIHLVIRSIILGICHVIFWENV